MFIISSIDVLINRLCQKLLGPKKKSEKQDIYEPKLTMYTF